MKQTGILLFVDGEKKRTFLEQILARYFTVHPASSVVESRELMFANAIEMVVIDAKCAFGEGREFLESVATHHQGTQILLLSGRAGIAKVKKYFHGEGCYYLGAPFSEFELVQLIKMAIERKGLLVHKRSALRGSSDTKAELQTKDLELSYLSLAVSAATVWEMRDPYFRNHSFRMVEIAAAMARKLKLNERQLTCLEYASVLRDIGMIPVSDAILYKPGRLTDGERVEILKHPVVGENVLSKVPKGINIARIVGTHHERWDGSGYPKGLSGSEIPIEARILGIVDSYIAMMSPRPHRRAMRKDDAISQIMKSSGSLYDPELVELFLEAVRSSQFDAA
jgi:response regulator RpfG family c-di-GMP phosphodiesterase